MSLFTTSLKSITVMCLIQALSVNATMMAAEKGGGKPSKKQAERDMALTPETAGPDFAISGEYLGQVNLENLGVQVIAMGDGDFTAVLLPGGLPGAGAGNERIECTGKRTDAGATFTGEGVEFKIIDGKVTGTKSDGATFILEKVMRKSPTLGMKPPEGAIVLFDGTSTDAWEKGAMDAENNLKAGALTKQKLTSFNLHLEFRLPFKPFGRSQDRCNSGVYIHQTYEFQVLDSFGLPLANNHAGALYTTRPPLLNMVFPPLSWQTYDIDFTGPGFDSSGKKIKNARATVKLNGVVVQDDIEIEHGTGANKKRPETPEGGHLYLQDHGNPVVYRNIWFVPKP